MSMIGDLLMFAGRFKTPDSKKMADRMFVFVIDEAKLTTKSHSLFEERQVEIGEDWRKGDMMVLIAHTITQK